MREGERKGAKKFEEVEGRFGRGVPPRGPTAGVQPVNVVGGGEGGGRGRRSGKIGEEPGEVEGEGGSDDHEGSGGGLTEGLELD